MVNGWMILMIPVRTIVVGLVVDACQRAMGMEVDDE